ncbi:MAG: FG-GAP repeat protein [Ignavibacteria bacterium]|nr:FG-GAP repeat protein [Ignavibacteria bacterium]
MTGEAANYNFGRSVSMHRDINGDGYSDVIVGSYGYISSKGRAYIFYGGPSMNNIARCNNDRRGGRQFIPEFQSQQPET